jgi:hypothetical protein
VVPAKTLTLVEEWFDAVILHTLLSSDLFLLLFKAIHHNPLGTTTLPPLSRLLTPYSYYFNHVGHLPIKGQDPRSSLEETFYNWF